MTFEEYLDSKKIDAESFKTVDPNLYAEWQNSYDQLHPNSFTAQKLYVINSIRRKFPKILNQKN